MSRLICDSKVEVLGRIMIPAFGTMKDDEIRPLQEKYGVTEIDADQWYPIRPWLDMMNELATLPNFTENMVAVGLKSAQDTLLLPEMANISLEQFLQMWNTNYQMSHRNGDVGSMTFEKVDNQYFRMILRDIYPDDVSYGALYGFAKVMLPKESKVHVWYENSTQRRDYGNGDYTIIGVRWE